MIKRIDHVGVVVDDLEEAMQFVGNTLGLHFEREVDVPVLGRHIAFFRCGDVSIELIRVEDPVVRAQVLRGRKAVIEHLAMEVEDLAAVLDTLASAGVRWNREPREIGGQVNIWTDPESL